MIHPEDNAAIYEHYRLALESFVDSGELQYEVFIELQDQAYQLGRLRGLKEQQQQLPII